MECFILSSIIIFHFFSFSFKLFLFFSFHIPTLFLFFSIICFSFLFLFLFFSIYIPVLSFSLLSNHSIFLLPSNLISIKYALTAVVRHHGGSASAGHYTAICKDLFGKVCFCDAIWIISSMNVSLPVLSHLKFLIFFLPNLLLYSVEGIRWFECLRRGWGARTVSDENGKCWLSLRMFWEIFLVKFSFFNLSREISLHSLAFKKFN